MLIEESADATVAMSSTPSTDDGSSISQEPAPEVESVDTGNEQPAVETPPVEFDWEAWDGEEGTLPDDDARTWFKRIAPKYTARVSAAEERVRSLETEEARFKALLQGLEDPRIAETEQKYSAAQKELDEMRAAHELTKKQYEALSAEIAEAQRKATEEQVNKFYSTHKETLADPAQYELFMDLTDDEKHTHSFSFDVAIELVKKPAPVIEEARRLRADGLSEARAVEIALKLVGPVEPVPRRGATGVSGAGGRRAPTAASPAAGDEPSHDDVLNRTIAKHLQK